MHGDDRVCQRMVWSQHPYRPGTPTQSVTRADTIRIHSRFVHMLLQLHLNACMHTCMHAWTPTHGHPSRTETCAAPVSHPAALSPNHSAHAA
eukprot:364709-Chlamydomonas_euryale.AAC.20